MSASLAGAIDGHIHSSPDTVPRSQDDLELAGAAAAAGMRAIVLKNHHLPTAGRAALVRKIVPEVQTIGSVSLNAAVGGLNPDAVRATLALDGRVVWLPTVSAENHLRHAKDTPPGAVQAPMIGTTPVPVVDADGAPLPALLEVLDVIAEHDVALATGHLAAGEASTVLKIAHERGVRRMVVTHVDAPSTKMPIDMQLELAELGVKFERCQILHHIFGDPVQQVLEDVRAIGVEHNVVSTDAGLVAVPKAVEAFERFRTELEAAGMTEEEWRVMACDNPARLLALDERPL
jgi:hypothetical protein